MDEDFEEFVQVIKGTERAEATINKYELGLRQFSEWLEREDIDKLQAKPRDLERFLSHLKTERGFAPNTIKQRFTAVSVFYDDYKANHPDFENPTDKVDVGDYAPRRSKQEEYTKEKHVWLTKDEVRALVENVSGPQVRNRLLVLFQYFTGLRRQEVSDVKLDDLDRENRRAQVRGKGNTVHTAHWQPNLDGLMTAWLDGGYRDSSPKAADSPYLFVSQLREKLSGTQINRIIRTAAEDAGIQEILYTDAAGRDQYKITSHTLRHSFAMHWLQNGGSIEALSKHLAHSSVTTTEIYGEILDDRAQEEYQEFAPKIDF